MRLIDGKKVASEINAESAELVARLRDKHGLQPGLAVVLVGSDPASKVYVESKSKKSVELGIFSDKRVLPADATQAEVLQLVKELNEDTAVHGILVQSPPPPAINERGVIDAIDPGKDVDCFHPRNVGKLLIGDVDGFIPCTPLGIMVLLRRSGIDPGGRHAVIVGRSNLVGKPLAALLSQKRSGANATVTICHSATVDLAHHCRQADILVAAIGRAKTITADMVKDGAVVIDVGVNRIQTPEGPKKSRLVGDVDFEGVSKKASQITPVPGGVGPMTIAMLMRNAIRACCLRHDVAVADSIY